MVVKYFESVILEASFADYLKPRNRMKERNVLFNNEINKCYLQLYDIQHMVKNHSDNERKPTAATLFALKECVCGYFHIKQYNGTHVINILK